MSGRRLHSLAAWLAMTGGGLGIVLAFYVAAHAWEHSRLPFPANLGNARAAALLAQRPDPAERLKFAIVGDINNGVETFEAVIARLREEKDVSFLLLLGDCAADPNPHLHDYFVREFAETGLALPTFIVAGNHDVDAGKFDYTQFESLYGPANFSFRFHGDLFVGLGGLHTPQKRRETLAFLEHTLRDARPAVRRIYVFMHFAPTAASGIPTDGFDDSTEFQALLETYRVNYVFSGHYHRLARTEVNGVVYLVSGGGGARLRHDQFEDIGLFHHLTLIEAGNGVTSEHIIPIPPASLVAQGLEHHVERFALTVLVPAFGSAPLLCGLMGLAGTGALAWGVSVLWRQRRRGSRRPGRTHDRAPDARVPE
ncbi:MAG: Calcineurin-like phosphoesterase superfamily domain protein [Lentisphaerae bacterium ADurb.BinA184]|nr:MAG: Calcineurin-like phosphoesterase superfamily domain protein [Lentisphaerae bacterium ADurb.BinA184]